MGSFKDPINLTKQAWTKIQLTWLSKHEPNFCVQVFWKPYA